jgi:hypothetical protein
MRIDCCARARCGAGLTAAASPRTRDHEGDLSHPGNRGLFLWLKALGDVGAYHSARSFCPKCCACVLSPSYRTKTGLPVVVARDIVIA